METRGRKRKFNPHIPAHINQTKLPDNCYWDKSGQGHWFTTYRNEAGAQRRQRIAGPLATLSELHKLIEEFTGIDKNTYRWLSAEFQKQPAFLEKARNTQIGYEYASKILCDLPSKMNKPLGDTPLNKWSSVTVQKIVDTLTKENGPRAANLALSYTRRLFRWGKNRGYITDNIAVGVEKAKERKRQRLPSDDTYKKLIGYAKCCGKLTPKTKGSAPDYIWMVLELAYLCRLRGTEVCTMTEARATKTGVICERLKGSRTNIAEWNPRLQQLWDTIIARRDKIWTDHKYAIPLKPEQRPLFVNNSGDALKKSTFDSAWQRFIIRAIADGIITEEERFSAHDMKRKGATDTKGSRGEKQDAGGWKSPHVVNDYDKSIPVVKPSGE